MINHTLSELARPVLLLLVDGRRSPGDVKGFQSEQLDIAIGPVDDVNFGILHRLGAVAQVTSHMAGWSGVFLNSRRQVAGCLHDVAGLAPRTSNLVDDITQKHLGDWRLQRWKSAFELSGCENS